MLSGDRPVIFYLLNYGSSVRNMAKGGVLTKLASQGYALVLFCVNPADREAIAEELPPGSFAFEDLGPVRLRGWPRLCQRLRTYAWRARTNYRELQSVRGSSWRWTLSLQMAFGHLLRLIPFALWEAISAWGVEWPRGEELLRHYKPVALFLSNPIHDEAVAAEYCRARGLFTAVALESWDNLTNRGALYCFPNLLIVWNEFIRQQALRFHDFPPERAHATGIAGYDLYTQTESLPSETAWRAAEGLPPDGPVIVFAMASRNIQEDNDYLLEDLRRLRDSGTIPKNAHFLIRIHPKDYATAVEKYRGQTGVFIQQPRGAKLHALNDTTLGGSPVQLAATMRYASCVITVFSTIILDALCCGTPCVVVNYDAPGTPATQSVRRYLVFQHLRELMSFNAVPLASNAEELGRHVARFLSEPNWLLEERNRCAREESGGLDGLSAERTARLLASRLPGTAQPS